MPLLRQLRVLVRSRSLSFAKHYVRGTSEGRGVASVRWWSGDRQDVFYRIGTSDQGLIYNILFKAGAQSEYWLPGSVPHKTVLDIGANAGITSRYLSWLFPQATIHAFEPIAGNVEMLHLNTSGIARIRVHPFGLGDKNGVFPLYIPTDDQTNMGMFSMYSTAREGRRVEARIRAVPEVLQELNLGEIDIIKIDTEGAEFEILKAFPPELLSRVKWIYGELHSQGLEPRKHFAVLDYLSQWFTIECQKPLHRSNYSFDACNHSIAAQFLQFRRKRRPGRF